jgi:hypothetical protein
MNGHYHLPIRAIRQSAANSGNDSDRIVQELRNRGRNARIADQVSSKTGLRRTPQVQVSLLHTNDRR